MHKQYAIQLYEIQFFAETSELKWKTETEIVIFNSGGDSLNLYLFVLSMRPPNGESITKLKEKKKHKFVRCAALA